MTRSRSILIVEDNPADVRLVVEGLRSGSAGYDISTVGDVKEALEYLHRQEPYTHAPRPDLVLLDLNLPKQSGHEVLDAMKSDPSLRRIPVVVLSMSRAHGDVEQVYHRYGNAYVLKPLDLDAFLGTIRSIEHFWFKTATLPPR